MSAERRFSSSGRSRAATKLGTSVAFFEGIQEALSRTVVWTLAILAIVLVVVPLLVMLAMMACCGGGMMSMGGMSGGGT